ASSIGATAQSICLLSTTLDSFTATKSTAQAMSPRGAASLSAAALAAAQVSATPIPAAHLLYQQFLSAGAVAAQSQLLQGTPTAVAVSQTAPSLPPTQILPQAAAAAAAAAANAVAVAVQQQQQQQSVPSQQQQTASAPQSQQQQQQNQAFVLANAAQALAINQLLLQQNPLQQQVSLLLISAQYVSCYYTEQLMYLLDVDLFLIAFLVGTACATDYFLVTRAKST
ncbi:hypothetical protein WUBG_17694, partial [Wuchereria bancrofti]